MLELALVVGLALFFGRGKVDEVVTQKIQTDAYTRWDDLFKRYGSQYGVDWMLLKATCWVESDLGRNSRVARGLAVPTDVEGSKSYDGLSWGLMQVTLPTASDFRPGTTVPDLNNPVISVELAAKITARNQKLFPGNLEYTVRAYNGGPGFLKTARGLSDTPIYWAKVKAKLDSIKANGG